MERHIHFGSWDERFCGSKETPRQIAPDEGDVTCPQCKAKDILTLTPDGAAYVRSLESL